MDRALPLHSLSLDCTHDHSHPQYVRLPCIDPSLSSSFKVTKYFNDTVVHGFQRFTRSVRTTAKTSRSWEQRMNSVRGYPSALMGKTKTNAVFYKQNWLAFQCEVLCGIAAMLLQIPETIAFSYVANLDPLMGLYATGFFGLVVSVFGGVPATIAGAAGAVAVVMPQLTGSTGSLRDLPYEQRLEHLFVAVTIVGLMQLVFGLFGWSKFFSMIPRTAHIGFLNGLAIMMFLSQMTTFKDCTNDTLRFGECEFADELTWMKLSDPTLWITIGVVLVTMLIMHFFPRMPYIGRAIPPTLVVAIVGVGFEFGINRPLIKYDLRTIGDTSPLSGGFPSFQFPDFANVQDWGAVLSCAASIAAVGIFESIMTLQAIVDLTKQRLTREACRKECVAQGIANLLCGFFSAMGGCSMIGQSAGNILNGAHYRLSTFVCGVATFAAIVFASSAIELVPIACLTGILFVIIAHTFYWPSLRLVFHMKMTDSFAVVLVTALAAAINLAVAVIAGVIWQSLVNGWRSGQQISSLTTIEYVPVIHRHKHSAITEHGDDSEVCDESVKVYYIKGQLLFSSVATFRGFFDFVKDPMVVVLDLRDCIFADFSAVAALREAATRYREAGKTLVARHLGAQSLDLLHHDIGWSIVSDIQTICAESCEVCAAEEGQHDVAHRPDSKARVIPASPVVHNYTPSPFSPRRGSSSPTMAYHILTNDTNP